EQNVGHILVDNIEELHMIQKYGEVMDRVTPVSLRIKPGIDAHTHQFIRTGQIDSKFGFALETGEAMQAVKETLALPNLQLRGVQCHIGSQIFDIAPFEEAARVMLHFMDDVRKETGYTIELLDLGGGFGIRYTDADEPVPYRDYMQRVSKVVHDTCRELSLPVPYIYIEPGRSVVGEAGLTLYTVGSVKEIPGVRNYVSVDGGMTDNPRYILYQSSYDVLLANHADKEPDYTATIAGRCCESGDLIQENVKMVKPKAGDLVAVLATGAYNYSMASNYNRVNRPPVIMVRGGTPRVVVRRESYEDLVRNDL
ncbi:MAG: diaminopimelate decarboxylase, partial [Acutalibacteraceae bacterium]